MPSHYSRSWKKLMIQLVFEPRTFWLHPPSLPSSLPPSLPFPLPPNQEVFWWAQCEGHAVNSGTTSPQNGTWNRDPQRDIFQSRKHISLQLPGRKYIQDQPPNNKVTATRRSFVTCDSSSFKALSSSGREFWSSPYTCKVIKWPLMMETLSIDINAKSLFKILKKNSGSSWYSNPGSSDY